MVNFGPLTAEIDWRVWGTPSYFNGYRYCTASSSGHQPNFAALNRGCHLFGRATIRLGISPHSSSFFFFPRLISAAADWMSAILPHMVWTWCEFKMQVWNLLHAARWKHRTQKSRQKSPSGHHRTTLSGYIFATETHINNQKKLVKQQYVLHMSPQYGELRPTSGWDRLTSLGYPCKFQLVSRLGSVTAQHLVVGVSQTLWRWTKGATYIRQGDHHVGHWPTFLVFF